MNARRRLYEFIFKLNTLQIDQGRKDKINENKEVTLPRILQPKVKEDNFKHSKK